MQLCARDGLSAAPLFFLVGKKEIDLGEAPRAMSPGRGDGLGHGAPAASRAEERPCSRREMRRKSQLSYSGVFVRVARGAAGNKKDRRKQNQTKSTAKKGFELVQYDIASEAFNTRIKYPVTCKYIIPRLPTGARSGEKQYRPTTAAARWSRAPEVTGSRVSHAGVLHCN